MTALGPARTIPDRRPKARASRPGILLDRDGTLIVDHGYVGSIDRIDFIDGAAAAIALFNRAALPVVIVTNQSGVTRGLYGLGEVEAVHARHRWSPTPLRSSRRHVPVLPVPPLGRRRSICPYE